jgi:hypothetical protein
MSLADLAFNRTVATFEAAPFHAEKHLKTETAKQFFARLNTALPPAVGAIFIQNEEYWKRACQDTGKPLGRDGHCISYKQGFFELFIQEVVDSYSNDSELLEAIKPFSDYIHTLHLDSLFHEFPLELLCAHLPNLSKLELKYSHKYEAGRFQALGSAITSSPFLVSLMLKDTGIKDNDIASIFENQCNLSHLDLSHNQITSQGVALLVNKFISPSSLLNSLDLSGNKICQVGASTIGAALADNESLLSLNLGLNHIGDKGGVGLLQGIKQNRTLRHINISANKLGSESASAISHVVSLNGSLESIVLTSNAFSEDDLKELRRHKICIIGTPVTLATNNIGSLASEVPS